MGKIFAKSALEHQDLASVNDFCENIDVFVSHKSDDEDKAIEVARCVKAFGLTAWVDSVDMQGVVDDKQMAGRIQDAISRASSLIAVVTNVTNESWWVPFEIGLAYEQKKFLASYCENMTAICLPSYLSYWPVVVNHPHLREWCKLIKEPKMMIEAYGDDRQVYRDRLFRIRDKLR